MKTLIEYAREHMIEKIVAVLRLPPQGRRYLAKQSTEELEKLQVELMRDVADQFEPYRVIGADMISVCATCYPGDKIRTLFPDLANVRISHGICRGHLRRQLLEWEMMKTLRAATTETATLAAEAAAVEEKVIA